MSRNLTNSGEKGTVRKGPLKEVNIALNDESELRRRGGESSFLPSRS